MQSLFLLPLFSKTRVVIWLLLILGAFSIGLLIVLVLLVQISLCCYSITWPWLIRRSTWGKLMTNYAAGLDKIDIARGRSVPAPAYASNLLPSLGGNAP